MPSSLPLHLSESSPSKANVLFLAVGFFAGLGLAEPRAGPSESEGTSGLLRGLSPAVSRHSEVPVRDTVLPLDSFFARFRNAR